MKAKPSFGGAVTTVLVWGLIILFLPLCLVLLVVYALYTPIDYIKFKRSAYQKDFPRRYRWLCGRHTDNEVYTIVKENNLPVKYLRCYEDYELPGNFFYKDVALNFSHPFFFDEKKEAWLFWPHDEAETTDEITDEVEDEAEEEAEEENTDDCLEEIEARAVILERMRELYPDVPCTGIVYFYEEKFVTGTYGKRALEKMQQNPAFIIYQKRKLKDAIMRYLEKT
ncbi:MAG: hypothetical protein IJW50_03530 [Clostridia bacterium]|nr:hypothetical protein [Clostridia bacterium]